MFEVRWWWLVAAVLVAATAMAHNSPPPEDKRVPSVADEVLVRRISASGIPVSLWPVAYKRKSQMNSSKSIYPHSMSAYDLIWIPGGAVKILPRSANFR